MNNTKRKLLVSFHFYHSIHSDMRSAFPLYVTRIKRETAKENNTVERLIIHYTVVLLRSLTMRGLGHASETKNAYKILIQNTGHKRSLETPGSGYQGNTEIDLNL